MKAVIHNIHSQSLQQAVAKIMTKCMIVEELVFKPVINGEEGNYSGWWDQGNSSTIGILAINQANEGRRWIDVRYLIPGWIIIHPKGGKKKKERYPNVDCGGEES